MGKKGNFYMTFVVDRREDLLDDGDIGAIDKSLLWSTA